MDILDNPIFKLEITVWVFIPVYNFEAFLEQCFRSVMAQSYKNYKVVIINDGSTDGSCSIIERFCKLINGFLITNVRNMGAGHTKWQAIEYVRANGSLSDIFTILDGDDFYTTELALQTLVLTYLKNKCLFTYGSAIGEYNEKVEMVKDLRLLRAPDSKFLYQHPRSCNIYLLNYISADDFKDAEGLWLLRITDRQFIFKCIELAGIERVSIVKDILYNYRTHQGNIRNKIDNKYGNRVLKHISGIPQSRVLKEEIHIVMCCYKRHRNLKDIIKSVSLQSLCKSYVVNLHIINTNPDKWEETQNINYGGNLLKVHLCSSNENLYGYARFLYVKKLMKTTYLPYVIFIDDDQYLPPGWLEKTWLSREPLTYCCWYGRIFEKEKGIEGISYWNDKVPQHKRLLAEYDPKYKEFDYGGTGGSIIDCSVFLFDIVFKCPLDYRNIEDLWLSFVVKHIIGKPIKIMKNPISPFTFADTESTALWLPITAKKEEFLKLLTRAGYCFSDKINTDELSKIITSDNDSEESIKKFTFI